MKILLLGEFSAFHLNLKKGFEKLGHEVTLVAGGDGWKEIPNDFKILSLGVKNPILKIINMMKDFFRISSFKDYDVVQFMQPVVFPHYLGFNKLLNNILLKNNKKSFLIAAGSDSFYWENYTENFRYSPHHDMKYFDKKGKKSLYEKTIIYKYNKYLADKVDGIIPIMYDYDIGYHKFKNKKNIIPIPIDTNDIKYSDNIVNNKIVIFHGLNREGFKGSKFIKIALERIKEKYSDKVEVIVEGGMPYSKYLEFIKKTNIVIDQANSYSYGVNAVIAMGMGKIVLSGAEPETLKAFGLEKSPVVNILPNDEDIYLKLVSLIENAENFKKLGKEARNFVELFHDNIKVASEYINIYEEELNHSGVMLKIDW
jgi:glycosyltransferase involved in cell wall biosynthesis